MKYRVTNITSIRLQVLVKEGMFKYINPKEYIVVESLTEQMFRLLDPFRSVLKISKEV